MARLTEKQLDAIVAGLLAATPAATLLAIAESGLVVPMPAGVPRQGHHIIANVVSAMDLATPPDVDAVITAWTEARERGTASVRVRAMAAPSVTLELTFVDARHAWGVYLGFVGGAQLPGSIEPPAGDHPLRPRFGISYKNELGIYTHCDEGLLRMFGWSAEELVGHRSIDLVHPEDQPRIIGAWMDLLAHPGASRRTRLRLRRPDDSWLWIEVTHLNLLNDPDHGHVVGETMDIADEMAAAEALREERELLARLTDALPVGIVQFGQDGAVRYRNDRLEAILGQPVRTGARLDELWPPDGGHSPGDQVRETLAEGADSDHETPLNRPDGSLVHIQASIRALRGGGGEVTGAVACLHDVTEAARLREELAHQATYDGLTGCLSRRALLERLEIMLSGGRPVTAMFVDLDDFKQVNDGYGHSVGDALLHHVGTCLREQVGGRGLVGRLGGDEFLVATTVPGDDEQARAEAAAVRAALEVPLVVDGHRLTASASIGLARSGETMRSADALVAAADGGMYRAKAARRERRHG